MFTRAALAIAAVLALAAPAAAQTGCGAPFDSAFGRPAGCPTPQQQVRPRDQTNGWTTTPDGRRVIRSGNTEATTSGYIQGDVVSGSGNVRPRR